MPRKKSALAVRQMALVARQAALPPILASSAPPDVRRRVERFYTFGDDLFEAWVTRRSSRNTQRAYRADVMAFVHSFSGSPGRETPWSF